MLFLYDETGVSPLTHRTAPTWHTWYQKQHLIWEWERILNINSEIYRYIVENQKILNLI